MTYDTILYVAFSSITIFISIITAFMFWKRRKAGGAFALSLLMILTAQWSLSDLISALVVSPSLKIMWNSIAYVGIALVPVTWLVFSLQYAKFERLLTGRSLFLLCIMPAATVMLAITNNAHHFFKLGTSLESLGPGGVSLVVSKYGPGFYIHTAYSYVLIMSGTILLLTKLIRLPKIYRNQAIIMTFAVLTPLVGNILYVAGISPSKHVDITAFSFIISGMLCFWGLFRYKLLDLIPAAREAVIESMDDIIIVLDDQNRIIDINTAAKSALNMSSVDLIGKLVSEILVNNYSSFKKYEDMVKVSEKITIEIHNQKKFYDLRVFPLYDSKSRINGRFIVMRDITLLERALIELENSRKIAVDASKAKSQFLATMSHEIRTPLNGIIGMTELLSSSNLTEEEKTYLEAIEYSTNSLLDIINEILDFSKIEAGKMDLESITFNISDLVNNIVKYFLHKKNENNLSLICDIDKTISQNIIGDPVRLRQILVNLLSNAFKFTKEGSIKVKVEKVNSNNNQELLLFSVSDTGIGIPKDKISMLFENFHQLDNSTTRKYGGTGLGLAIAKNLTSLMGGFINVESEVGKGSSFSFQIPFKTPELSSVYPVQVEPTSKSDDTKLKVLLAEDNNINQIFMTNLLSKRDWIVDTADTGKKVLEKLETNDYDLILMDIQMPEMDGLEATVRIREKEITTGKHIPIIALTANATEEDKTICLQSGMDDYLTKPIRSAKLFPCIDKYISL